MTTTILTSQLITTLATQLDDNTEVIKMKIENVLNTINKRTYTVNARILGDNLFVFASNECLNWFLKVPLKATGWFDVETDWPSLGNVAPTDFTLTMDTVQALVDTPVGERFPEKKYRLQKKYRLRWIDDGNKAKNYLSVSRAGDWLLTTVKREATVFTESDLKQLKKDNPRLTFAINAMKEEVKDNEQRKTIKYNIKNMVK